MCQIGEIRVPIHDFKKKIIVARISHKSNQK